MHSGTAVSEGSSDFKTLSLIALVLMVGAPLAYLGLIYYLKTTLGNPENPNDRFVYMIMLVAFVQPAMIFVLHRTQIKNYKRSSLSQLPTPGNLNPSGPAGAARTLFAIKMALVQSIFVYGMLTFFVTYQTQWIWYFYAWGALWALFVYPTRERFDDVIRQLEAASA